MSKETLNRSDFDTSSTRVCARREIQVIAAKDISLLSLSAQAIAQLIDADTKLSQICKEHPEFIDGGLDEYLEWTEAKKEKRLVDMVAKNETLPIRLNITHSLITGLKEKLPIAEELIVKKT